MGKVEFPRRTVQELIAKLSYEPSLCDVYVEGAFDQEVLSMRSQRIGKMGLSVFEIDTIDIAPNMWEPLGLNEGQKQRLIALANTIDGKIEPTQCICVIDSDTEAWTGLLFDCDHLVRTKFCSLEVYCLTQDFTEGVLRFAKCKVADMKVLFEGLVSTLRSMFSLRCAEIEMGQNLTWVPPNKSLDIKSQRIVFDFEDFVDRLLSRNGQLKIKSDFCHQAKLWEGKFIDDPRYFVRGHDFVNVLAWAIPKVGGKSNLCNADILQRLVYHSLVDSNEVDHLIL